MSSLASLTLRSTGRREATPGAFPAGSRRDPPFGRDGCNIEGCRAHRRDVSTTIHRTDGRFHMTETATFGAGCFWGVEWVFRKVPGVLDAVSGYSGGSTVNPTYRDVCSHTTGHAEVVRVTFDPAVITYEQLLEVF